MALKKITDADLSGKGVAPLPDAPGLPAEEMKAKFEEIVRAVVIPAVNEHAETAYDKAEVDTRINAAVLATGAADMAKATYDPRGKAADAFCAACIDLAGYTKPAGPAALAAADSVSAALGKLEAAVDEKLPLTEGMAKNTYDAAAGARQVQFEQDARLNTAAKTVPGAINELRTTTKLSVGEWCTLSGGFTIADTEAQIYLLPNGFVSVSALIRGATFPANTTITALTVKSPYRPAVTTGFTASFSGIGGGVYARAGADGAMTVWTSTASGTLLVTGYYPSSLVTS